MASCPIDSKYFPADTKSQYCFYWWHEKCIPGVTRWQTPSYIINDFIENNYWQIVAVFLLHKLLTWFEGPKEYLQAKGDYQHVPSTASNPQIRMGLHLRYTKIWQIKTFLSVFSIKKHFHALRLFAKSAKFEHPWKCVGSQYQSISHNLFLYHRLQCRVHECTNFVPSTGNKYKTLQLYDYFAFWGNFG